MATPFLKWAGGKTRLQPQLLRAAPERIRRYREPFVGGGALFFALHTAERIEASILADTNPDLVLTYEQVRDAPESVIKALRALERRYLHADDRAVRYYAVRASRPRSPLQRAARVLFLNKTCYNGLYRVNRAGVFNVPHGRYTNPTICNAVQLRNASAALRDTRIELADFEAACEGAGERDFIYFDPPYQPVSKTSHFTAYTSEDFSWEEQIRLRNVALRLAADGAQVLISNSYQPEVEALYRDGGFCVRTVLAARAINSKASKRGATRELLIASYPLPEFGIAFR